MLQFGLLAVYYTNFSISFFLAEGLTKCKDTLSLGDNIQGQIFLKPPLRWRSKPWHCIPHKQHSMPLLQSPSFQGRVEKCCVARGISVLEMKSLASQNHQPEASGLGKPPPLSEQATLTLLRLTHISPILGLAKAGKDFGFFFFPLSRKLICPGQNHVQPKWALTTAVSELFYLKPSWAYTSHFIFSDKTPEKADQAEMQYFVNRKGLSLTWNWVNYNGLKLFLHFTVIQPPALNFFVQNKDIKEGSSFHGNGKESSKSKNC